MATTITEFRLNPLDGSTTTEYSDGTVKTGNIVPAADLTAADVARVRFTPVAEAALSTTTGASIGAAAEISDGPNAGAKLVWSIPANESQPAWCWWLWPQSKFEG